MNAGAVNIFERARQLSGRPAKQSALEKQASGWVSQTCFGTLLKQRRESPFRSGLFDGGRGGQAFGSLYDQHLAEHMSRGAGKKLVRAIVRKLEANRAYSKQRPNPVGEPASAGGHLTARR